MVSAKVEAAAAHPALQVWVLPLPQLLKLAQRRVAALRSNLPLALRSHRQAQAVSAMSCQL